LSAEVVWLQNLISHHVPLLSINLYIIRDFITESFLLYRFGNTLPWGLSQNVLLAGMFGAGTAFKSPFCGCVKDRPVEAEAFSFVKRIS
jgi:hypothetical protein